MKFDARFPPIRSASASSFHAYFGEHHESHSASAALEALALPIYPELTEKQQRYLVEEIKAFLPIDET
jgi:hypothetical protein